ncbi:putative Ig domain-containing protein [Arenimonas sp.]|uniref:putative Ig domain-containing protein n=1 Tax=Arenimonas sp. TaxID=1872635 RepID=UPI002D80EB0E|nr:putative Ig domain-containing protein [Arenimonas sp.]
MAFAWASGAAAVGLPSTYAGCQVRNETVAWGGTVNVDLSACHFFGLGVVSTPPVHGTATEGDIAPVDSYNYNHNGSTGTTDQFVVLDDNSDFITVNITIQPPTSAITVSPATLPALTAGTPFSQTLTSAGGTAPYTYTLESGTLATGITLSSAGVVSGTPTQRGAFSFTVRSTDSLGDFVTKSYSDTVNNPTLSIPASGTAIQGVPFSQTLTVTGGVAPHSFLLETGAFPAGITVSSAGVVSGTTAEAPGNYPVTLRVTDSSTGPGSYFELESYTLTVSPPPSVSIAVAPASVSEDGATNLTYTVTRSLNLSSPTVVNITTTGTATAGTDYTGNVATVTIPAGATTAVVTINPSVDGTVEPDETVTLTVAAGTGYTVGAPASATGTILNDDVPSATISVSPAAVAEDGAPNLIYTVTLNQPAFSALSLNYTIGGTAANGTDYATIASPLVIPAGNSTGTVTVNPTADATIEADETVTLTLAAGAGYTVGVPNSATGTILNDDLPNLTINDVTVSEGNAGITNFTFTVSLSAPAGPGGVTFNIATANGSATAGVDYVAQSLTGQTIPAGSSTYTFTALVNGDTLNEPSETFFVNVTGVVNAVVVDGQGVGTIVNDDPLPSLAINDVTVVEGNAGTVNAVFTVTLGAASGQTVSVNYATADGTATQPADYTNTSGTLTFTPGQTTRTITVPVIGETVPEANETFFVNLSGATNATISDNQGVGTITNDDVPVTVSPGALPNGTVAAAYSQAISASGGVGPYNFAVTAGALPAGLTLSPGGVLSGTPTAGGSFNFTVTATDSSPFPGPFSGSQAYLLTIAPPTISLPATALAGGTLGSAYSESITAASGGTAPYAYAVTAGALPGGLTLNPASGAITGTPSALGTFNFSITATDSSTGTGPYTATQAYAITVIDVPPVANAVSVTVPFNAAATNVTLDITGGAPVSVAIGTAASNGTAIASGTSITYQPNAGYSGPDSFTYTATNSGGTSAPATVTVTVTDPVISITNGNPLTGTVAVAYTQTFSFNGGTAPWSGYQVTNLPAGVSITGTTANTVTVSGTPTEAGTFTLNVSATDSSTGNGPFTVGQAFSLSIGAPTLTLSPAAGSLNAPYAVAYSQAFSAGGGTGPYSYAVTGALPAGISLVGDTLAGTPVAPGSYLITITATDTGSTGTGAPFTIAQDYTLVVPAPVIVVDPTTLPAPTAGAAYSQTITATGGVAPYGFAVTAGSLPNGLVLSAGGTLSGTATEVGAFNFTVTATDANGQTGSRAYSFNVAAPVLTMTPASGTLNAPYAVAFSQAFTAGGSPGPYSYVLTGTLPAGMSFSSGTLSGTPTVPGSYPVTVTATDTGLTGVGAPFSIAQNYTIDVPAPTIVVNPATLANGTAGQAYAASLSATGAVAPYGFAVTAGALPPGMALSTGGALSGTPTSSGTFNFTVTATDPNGQTGSRAYGLVIDVPVLAITPATLPSGIVGVAYGQTVSASGGVAPYSFAVTAGALPGGLALAPDGTLSGTPTAAGIFNFTVTATDSTGGTAATAAQAYSVEIVFAPPVAVDDTATVLAGASVTIPVTANDTSAAPITSIAIASPPATGTVTVSGLDVVYTAPTLSPASVTFTYTATGPGGTSAPATVTVTVNPLPIPANFDVTTTPATPVSVTLTAGATGGPFTGASVVSVNPAASGTAVITASGADYVLTFTPDAAFSGSVVVEFTLDNAFATSAIGLVNITVEERPDPSQDPEVQGMLDAQAEATRRFATAQIGNFQQRLERLHRGGGGTDGIDNTLGFSIRPQCVESVVTDWMDPCSDTLGSNEGGRGPAGNGAANGGRTGGGRDSALNAWVGGVIRSGSADGRNGSADVSFETDGASAGMDYRVSESLALGAGIGYGRDDNEIGSNGSRVKGDATTLATYASYHPGESFYLDGLLGFQRLSFDLRRYVTPTDAFVYGQRDGDQWFASISTGADIRRGAVNWNPYLRLDLARATLDGYTETGDAIYALRFGAMDVDTTTGNLGLRVDSAYPMGWGVFSPMFRVEYQHDFHDRANASVQYADLVGGPAFPLVGTEYDNNRWVLGLGARFDLTSDWSFGLEYRGQVGSDGERDNGLLLNVQKDY